jgi:GTPase
MTQGLGHEFLRHIERTKVLLYVLDGLGGQGHAAGSSDEDEDDGDDGSITDEPPAVVLRKLREELERYRPGLTRRPSLVWINKADIDAATAARAQQAVAAVLVESWNEETAGEEGARPRRRVAVPVLVGSAKTGERIGDLAVALRQTLQEARALAMRLESAAP